MNLHYRSLFLAAVAGLLVHTLFGLINIRLSQELLDAVPTGLMAVASSLVCVLSIAADAGVGALYAYLHSRHLALSTVDGAVGGVAATALARIGSSVIGSVISIAGAAGNSAADQLTTAVAGSVIGLCLAATIGIVPGAFGGWLGASMIARRQGHS